MLLFPCSSSSSSGPKLCPLSIPALKRRGRGIEVKQLPFKGLLWKLHMCTLLTLCDATWVTWPHIAENIGGTWFVTGGYWMVLFLKESGEGWISKDSSCSPLRPLLISSPTWHLACWKGGNLQRSEKNTVALVWDPLDPDPSSTNYSCC